MDLLICPILPTTSESGYIVDLPFQKPALTMLLVVFPIVFLTFLLVQETTIAYRSVVEWVQAGGMKQAPGVPR